MEYLKASLTTDIIIVKDKQVLLIQRKNDPFENYWALPGGFVDIIENEDILTCAQRELKEETGIDRLPLTQFKAYANASRDPRGYTASIIYFCILPSAEQPKVAAGDDAKDYQWVPLQNLKEINLAFDHQEILTDFNSFLNNQ